MFEQSKSSASPVEPRGRSPADTAATPDGLVRPTSKVRASFVSVEPGKLIPADPEIVAGAADAASSSTTHRRESFSVSEDIRDDVTAALKKEVSESQKAPKDSEAVPDVLSDVVPEQAVETRESSRDPPPMHEDKAEGTMPSLGNIMKGSDLPGPSPATENPEVEPEAIPEEAPIAPVLEEVQEDIHEEEQEEISELDSGEISDMPEDVPELEPEDVSEVVHEEPQKEEPKIETEETEEALKEEAKEESKEVEEKPTTSAPLVSLSDNPDKIETEVQEEAVLKPADPEDEAAVSGGKALTPPAEDLRAEEPSPSVTEPSPAAAEPSVVTTKAAGSPMKSKVNGRPVANAKIATKKPPKISTTKAAGNAAYSSMSPLIKSPGFARLPKTPTTPRAVSLTSKARSPAPVSRSPAPTSKSPAPASKSPTPTQDLLKPTAPKTAATKPVAPKTVAPKAATTTPKPAAPKVTPAVNQPIRAPVAKTSRSSLRPSVTATAPPKPKAPVTETKKPAPRPLASAHPPNPAHKESTATTSTGGFKKPKPKSPTRPVRLPSHLTAQTAASAAKHGDEAPVQKLVRKPSTTRQTPKTALPARKISSRASLAPTTAPAKRPESRTSTKGGADEGFLARMMRPTNASASKTHDKPVSPPRRGNSVRLASKPKGHESVVSMGKRKVDEVATKAKDAVTNGHGSAHHSDDQHAEDHHTEDHHNEDQHSEDHHNEDQHTEAGAVEPNTPKEETPVREDISEQGVESSCH
jgi:hypothetical protein